MCNLYSMRGKPRDWAAHYHVDRPDIDWPYEHSNYFPDRVGPVIRNADGGREVVAMRWGFPPAKRDVITNVRYTEKPFWRKWLQPEYRCLVPVTSFAEYAPEHERDPVTKKLDVLWFALNDNRPPFAFAGIWRPWNGTRGLKKAPVLGDHLLYAFLTTEPNEVMAPIHPKAMPVILADPKDWDTWLNGSVEEALELQRPAPADMIKVVARGTSKED